MLQEVHPSCDQLDGYFLETLSEADLESVEEHLVICERCQNELALTGLSTRTMKRAADLPKNGKRLRSIHITEDGPIFGAMHGGVDGKWIARHWGRQLDGFRIYDSAKEADEYLTESFRQMFPDHLCSELCEG